MNFFTGNFQGFYLLFRNTYLKEPIWVAASVYFNREASQGSTYFLGKYYSRRYVNVKIPDSNFYQGEHLFREGITYLLLNKYWRSIYFPVNKYWEVHFSGDYFLTVTPVPDPKKNEPLGKFNFRVVFHNWYF